MGGNVNNYWQAIVTHKRSRAIGEGIGAIEDIFITQQIVSGGRIGGYLDGRRAQHERHLTYECYFGSVVAAAGTCRVQYTKDIHLGFGEEIIHFGKCCCQLYILSWAVVG